MAPVERPPRVPADMLERIEVLHPEQVWLFGSRARGEARADSDWDFMAILADDAPESDLDLASVWQRLRDLRLRRVEVFTMTRSEFDEWKRSPGTLAEIVASTGVVVYDAAVPLTAGPRMKTTSVDNAELEDMPEIHEPRFRRRPGRGHHASRPVGSLRDRRRCE